MGNGIAHVCALAGFSVLLNDVSADRIKAGMATINGNMARQVSKKSISEEDRKSALARIKPAEKYDAFSDCDLVVGTEEELHAAGGSEDTLAAIRTIRALSKATIVCKRGPMGCVVFPGAIPASIEDGIKGPGFPVEVYNILGAGDAFAAGFIYGRLQGWDWFRSARMGNACGAIVVTRHGCANFMGYASEVLDFVEARGGF